MPNKSKPARSEWIIDCHNHIGTELIFYFQGAYPYCQDIPSLVEHQASRRLTHWIVFPFVTNQSCGINALASGKLDFEESPDAIPYAFENRRLLREAHDYFPEHADRLLPFVMVDPNRRVAEQEKELRSLRERYRFHGIKIQATILESPIRGLLGEGAALVELAREWDLPFLIHSSIAESDTWSQCADILDVAEANPDVRFCLAHSCRFHKPSLDRLASLPNTWFDCSAHIIHCRSVLRGLENVAREEARFPSDYRDPPRVLADLYDAYPDRFLWGSDSPFYNWITDQGELPCSLKTTYMEEVNALYELPEAARHAVTNRNTLAYLSL